MERFSQARNEDQVYCRIYGDGEIIKAQPDSVVVRFHNHQTLHPDKDAIFEETYWVDGRMHRLNSIEPTLYFRSGGQRYLEARPAAPDSTDNPLELGKPFFRDDESAAVFAGGIIDEGRRCDVYLVCPGAKDKGTIIVRHGAARRDVVQYDVACFVASLHNVKLNQEIWDRYLAGRVRLAV